MGTACFPAAGHNVFLEKPGKTLGTSLSSENPKNKPLFSAVSRRSPAYRKRFSVSIYQVPPSVPAEQGFYF